MTRWWHQDDRTLLRLSGTDTRRLLQGIVTNNIDHLDTQPAIFSLLLTPQGKLLHDFFLIADGEDVLVDIATTHAAAWQKKLTMYRLRADMTITQPEDWHVYTSPDGAITPHGISFIDPRYHALGSRMAVQGTPDITIHGDATSYDGWRLQHGIAEAAHDMIDGRSFALEMHYDTLHAIDFHKGCYVGQEVTARAKHRGTLRKQMLPIHSDTPLPPPDTPLYAGEQEIGRMRSSRENIGIGLIRLDAWDAALEAGQYITAAGQKVTITRPEWVPAPASA
ncbi:MAG: folate-binding protein YgfZ [Sphaerospermopsis sp. SIO1G2]|nr:folate-binding protein YgfZ [Sphaerospermopsis sp. SIO1G2]